jgi:hypothetical protein
MYIICLIETVAHERFYKDVAHELLHPAVLKDPRSHLTSPPPDVAPTRTTHSGGASSSSSITNSRFLKMFQGIFAMCRHTDQRMDVMETYLDIVHRNQEIIHSQQDAPLIEFPDVPVYPPPLIPDPYASLTLAELAAFGIGPSRTLPDYDDDDDVEGATNDDEETKDDE